MEDDVNVYDEAAQQAVELANRLAEQHRDGDLWDIADGLLAGVVHYWLYARQPCTDQLCEDCLPLRNPEERLSELLRLVGELARESDYFHSAHDTQVGRA